MPVHNSDIARTLNKVADLLDIEGDNRFRIRAYRNAARTISGMSKDVSDMVASGEDLNALSGIGDDLAAKIKEIVNTGSLNQLEELQKDIPGELTELLQIANLGPRRVYVLHEALDVTNLDDLKQAAEDRKIRRLDGFGSKSENNVLSAIDRIETSGSSNRIPLHEAEQISTSLLEYLRQLKGVKECEVAGSFRRRKETVGDLDILVTCRKDTDVMKAFVDYEDVDRVLSRGKTRSSVVLRTGVQVDLRVVPQVAFGAALLYFTGSKSHNVALRKLAVKRNLKVNEYGAFKNDDRVAGRSEREMYELFDLSFIAPELREDTGEIKAAGKGRLPSLITLKDLRGDLQAHTTASDGLNTLEEMGRAAQERGHDYLAITDHSKRVSMANGLDEKRLARHIENIAQLNERFEGFRLLKSVEVDILEDGTLDLSDDILRELDIVVCSIHYNFNLSRKQQTRRVLKAMENPVFNILAHPTGRRIGQRGPYDIDLETIMKEARDNGCFLEVNAQPDRLDLKDSHCRMARDMGVKLSISTDVHSVDDLNVMQYGVWQARRGWLEADDVINTRPWSELKKLLRR